MIVSIIYNYFIINKWGHIIVKNDELKMFALWGMNQIQR